jgi:hypothetical protein
MTEPKTFASLGPRLLARKGGAKPAMRSQLNHFHEATARQLETDCGWDDMGHDYGEEAEVVPIHQDLAYAEVAEKPVVVRQQEAAARRVADPPQRRSALDDGRRAAFTLRVDAERHLKLRLACTLNNRSAQQLVTEALDRLLADLPEITELAAQVAKRRS